MSKNKVTITEGSLFFGMGHKAEIKNSETGVTGTGCSHNSAKEAYSKAVKDYKEKSLE